MEGPAKNINDLPSEMLLKILSYIPIEDLATNARFVCNHWAEISVSDILWKDSFFSIRESSNFHNLPFTLEMMPKLQGFHAEECAPETFNMLAKWCKNLRKVLIDDFEHVSGIKGALQNLFTACKKLEVVKMPDLVLVEEELGKLLGQCGNLQSISLSVSLYNLIKLKHIAEGCPYLQHVEVTGARWSFLDMSYFMQQKGKRLLTLKVTHESVEKSCIIPLLSFCQNSLCQLQLEGLCHECSPATLNVIKTLSNLTSLKLTIPGEMTANAVGNIFVGGVMSRLTELEIEGREVLNKSLADTIFLNCPNLLKVALVNCYNLTDDALENLSMCTKLEKLELIHCGSLMDNAVPNISRCFNLKHLNIEYCKLIGKGFGHLIQLSELRFLKIVGCQVSKLPLILFPLNLRKLRRLIIVWCLGVKFEALALLNEEMPSLKIHVRIF